MSDIIFMTIIFKRYISLPRNICLKIFSVLLAWFVNVSS